MACASTIRLVEDERLAKASKDSDETLRPICQGVPDYLKAAYRIYWLAKEAGACEDEAEGDLAVRCATLGIDFLQLGEFLEVNQDDPEARAAWETLIQRTADSHLHGLPTPEYSVPSAGWPKTPAYASEA